MFTACTTKAQIKGLEEHLPYHATLNLYSGHDKPKYIKYKQMDSDFQIDTEIGSFKGKKGDYLFTDMSGGKSILPYKLFQKIFS